MEEHEVEEEENGRAVDGHLGRAPALILNLLERDLVAGTMDARGELEHEHTNDSEREMNTVVFCVVHLTELTGRPSHDPQI
jgi:hypothetical protein